MPQEAIYWKRKADLSWDDLVLTRPPASCVTLASQGLSPHLNQQWLSNQDKHGIEDMPRSWEPIQDIIMVERTNFSEKVLHLGLWFLFFLLWWDLELVDIYIKMSVENPWNRIIPRVCDSSQLPYVCVKGDKPGQEPELVPVTKLKPAPPNKEPLKRPKPRVFQWAACYNKGKQTPLRVFHCLQI